MSEHDDAFDELAERAGASLRRPAPAGGVAAVQQAHRLSRKRRAAAGAVLALALVAGGAAVIGRSGDDRLVPATSVPTPTVPASTVPDSTVPSTTDADPRVSTIDPGPMVVVGGLPVANVTDGRLVPVELGDDFRAGSSAGFAMLGLDGVTPWPIDDDGCGGVLVGPSSTTALLGPSLASIRPVWGETLGSSGDDPTTTQLGIDLDGDGRSETLVLRRSPRQPVGVPFVSTPPDDAPYVPYWWTPTPDVLSFVGVRSDVEGTTTALAGSLDDPWAAAVHLDGLADLDGDGDVEILLAAIDRSSASIVDGGTLEPMTAGGCPAVATPSSDIVVTATDPVLVSNGQVLATLTDAGITPFDRTPGFDPSVTTLELAAPGAGAATFGLADGTCSTTVVADPADRLLATPGAVDQGPTLTWSAHPDPDLVAALPFSESTMFAYSAVNLDTDPALETVVIARRLDAEGAPGDDLYGVEVWQPDERELIDLAGTGDTEGRPVGIVGIVDLDHDGVDEIVIGEPGGGIQQLVDITAGRVLASSGCPPPLG